MPLIASLAALIAAGFHVLFFVLESMTFSQPSVAARFGLTTPEQIAAAEALCAFTAKGFAAKAKA